MLVGLVGCGPKEPKQENEQTTTEQTTEAPKQKEKDTSKFDIFAQKNYEEFKFNASGAEYQGKLVDENGNDIHELEENFVEKLDINGYVFKETTETSDIRTHVYTKVETEIPNDSPTVEVPELKITRFIDTNGVELKNIVEGFVEKDSNIVYENEQYDYVNTTEESGY